MRIAQAKREIRERELFSLLFASLHAFPKLSSILRETVRAAGAYSRICLKFMFGWNAATRNPRYGGIPSVDLQLFHFSYTNFQATPFFVASCTLSLSRWERFCRFSLERSVIYHKGNVYVLILKSRYVTWSNTEMYLRINS